MTSSGMEPVTFRFVVQHLNHGATAVPTEFIYTSVILRKWKRVTSVVYIRCILVSESRFDAAELESVSVLVAIVTQTPLNST